MVGNPTDPRRGIALWVGTGVVALLCCCGVVVGVGYLYVQDERDKPGMRAAGEAYLTAVVGGDYSAAYDLLCARDRRAQPLATWQPTRGSTDPNGFRITDVAVDRPEGAGAFTLRTVKAEITRAGYPSSEVELRLEEQEGAWKVCSPPKL